MATWRVRLELGVEAETEEEAVGIAAQNIVNELNDGKLQLKAKQVCDWRAWGVNVGRTATWGPEVKA